MSHMEVSVRELRNRTAEVVAAVEAGQSVTLTNRGRPVADVIPHRVRRRWVPGAWLQEELRTRQADADLSRDLDELVGDTIEDL